jgi:photosystem II stability/assembly factor-like uncharacterized protein
MKQTRTINRIFFVFLLVTVQAAVSAQGTWERIPVPTTQYLKSVCFVDSLYGWIAGDSGVILHTTDGGASWNFQETNAVYDVEDVFFLNRNLGWASSFNFSTVPFGTVLLKTTNGGATWESSVYPEEDIFITCILFRDSLNGWMGGRPHALLRTADGGLNWAQAAIDTSVLAFFPVLSINFYNDQYGYASGGMFDIAGVTWHTSDGGNMWYAIDPTQAPADEVHSLHLFDSVTVMGAGGDPDFGYGVGMIRTSDGGANWTYDELTIQGNAYDLDFRTASEAWAPLGPRLKLIYSLDTGVTWTDIPVPGNTAVYDMIFPDSLHGFAVGKGGTVLKYHPPVIPSTPEVMRGTEGYSLSGNHPNPFRDVTRIKYSVPDAGKPAGQLQVRVFTVLGNEVATLPAGQPSTGDHEITFAAAGLPGGIYLYTLEQLVNGVMLPITPPQRMIILK